MKDKAIIVDLDGTLTNLNGRSPFKYHLSKYDLPQTKVIEYVRNYFINGIKVIILSGRGLSSEKITKSWLEEYDVPYTKLYLKPDKDFRPSSYYKKKILDDKILPYFNVIEILDDYKKNMIMFDDYGFNLTYIDEKTGTIHKNYKVDGDK